jgi:hypothetical protein
MSGVNDITCARCMLPAWLFYDVKTTHGCANSRRTPTRGIHQVNYSNQAYHRNKDSMTTPNPVCTQQLTCSTLLPEFNQDRKSVENVSKTLQYQISRKSVPWSSSYTKTDAARLTRPFSMFLLKMP